MKKRPSRQKRRYKKKDNRNHILLFIIFVFIAIVTIVALEYLNVQKGKSSFLFKGDKKDKAEEIESARASFNEKVQISLKESDFPYSHFVDRDKGSHHYKIDVSKKELKKLIGILTAVTRSYKGQFKEVERGMRGTIYLYAAYFQSRSIHKFLISIPASHKAVSPVTSGSEKPQKKTVPIASPPKFKTPRIAFIIDDVGYQNSDANQLKSLGIPITGAVIPHTPYASSEAKKLYAFNLEMLIHLPMQALNGDIRYNRNECVMVDSTIDEVSTLIDRARRIVPFAKGINNHMGSRVTSNRGAIMKVLSVIQNRGLFFVDSRTTTRTVAAGVARGMGVKAAEKDIFIDHIKTYDHSMEQIRKLIRVALYRGKGIGIGHPNPTTFKAIKDSIPLIREKGIKLVFVSSLIY